MSFPRLFVCPRAVLVLADSSHATWGSGHHRGDRNKQGHSTTKPEIGNAGKGSGERAFLRPQEPVRRFLLILLASLLSHLHIKVFADALAAPFPEAQCSDGIAEDIDGGPTHVAKAVDAGNDCNCINRETQ